MGILLRILGILWCLAALVVTLAAIVGAMAEAGTGGASVAYAIGAFLGAGLVLSPVWLTGIAFFLLPGWVRKQLGRTQAGVFA